MKLSVAIADANAGDKAFVVWRGFEESIRKAAEYGYDGVELALRAKNDFDAAEMRALLKRYRLEVSSISTGQVFADLGLYLTNADIAKRLEAVEAIRSLVELAEEFGGIINLGRVRGFIAPEQGKALAEELFFDSISKILPDAEKRGVTIVIEPVNRYEINFINSVASCAELLAKIPSKSMGIMPDVFHMNIEDVSIGGALREAGDLVKYVHLADSNRLAPGWGHLDFDEVFAALADIGYDEWVSAEIFPTPTPDEAAKQAADYLLPRVRAHRV